MLWDPVWEQQPVMRSEGPDADLVGNADSADGGAADSDGVGDAEGAFL